MGGWGCECVGVGGVSVWGWGYECVGVGCVCECVCVGGGGCLLVPTPWCVELTVLTVLTVTTHADQLQFVRNKILIRCWKAKED